MVSRYFLTFCWYLFLSLSQSMTEWSSSFTLLSIFDSLLHSAGKACHLCFYLVYWVCQFQHHFSLGFLQQFYLPNWDWLPFHPSFWFSQSVPCLLWIVWAYNHCLNTINVFNCLDILPRHFHDVPTLPLCLLAFMSSWHKLDPLERENLLTTP